jgi:hypothetical protein
MVIEVNNGILSRRPEHLATSVPSPDWRRNAVKRSSTGGKDARAPLPDGPFVLAA